MLVKFKPAADRDVIDLTDYIAEVSGSRQIAVDYVSRIVRSCLKLGEFPELGRKRDDVLEGLRILPFERRAIVAYRIEKDTVFIHGVFYGGRDYEAIMEERGLENF